MKKSPRNLAPYLGLAGIAAGSSMLISNIAGASTGLLVAGCMFGPSVILLAELVLFGGGKRVAQMMGGRPADEYLIGLVHEVAGRAHVPPPSHVFEVPSDLPNAFAAGFSQDDLSIAVTSGLRNALTPVELKAVIAHEIGHIQARDVSANMHLAVVGAGLGGMYEAGRYIMRSRRKKSSSKSEKSEEGDSSAALGLALMAGGVAAKLGGEVLRCSESRRAEYKADGVGAKLYGGAAMSSALRKIDALGARMHKSAGSSSFGSRSNFFAHSYISNPQVRSMVGAKGKDSTWQRLLRVFNTHPTLDERLDAISYGQGATHS